MVARQIQSGPAPGDSSETAIPQPDLELLGLALHCGLEPSEVADRAPIILGEFNGPRLRLAI
jgi:hypothetical protein